MKFKSHYWYYKLFFFWSYYFLKVLTTHIICDHFSLFCTISCQSSIPIAFRSSINLSFSRASPWLFSSRFSLKNTPQDNFLLLGYELAIRFLTFNIVCNRCQAHFLQFPIISSPPTSHFRIKHGRRFSVIPYFQIFLVSSSLPTLVVHPYRCKPHIRKSMWTL